MKVLLLALLAALIIIPAAQAGHKSSVNSGVASCTVSTTNVTNDTISGSGIPQEKPIYLYVLNTDGTLRNTYYAGFFFGVQPEGLLDSSDIGPFTYQYGGVNHNGNWHIYAECLAP